MTGILGGANHPKLDIIWRKKTRYPNSSDEDTPLKTNMEHKAGLEDDVPFQLGDF